MNNVYEKIKTCLASIREKTDFVPEVALILGSGLGDYADQIKIETFQHLPLQVIREDSYSDTLKKYR